MNERYDSREVMFRCLVVEKSDLGAVIGLQRHR